MHYYQFNIGDYKSHTEHLSDLEDLAYRRMLDLYYLHEKPLPQNVEHIARLIRMRTHSECIADVLREFFIETEDGWVNHRAETELNRIGTKSEKARESAKARWLKAKDKVPDANAMRTHSECNATQDTRHITQDTIHKEKKKDIAPPDGVLESVWDDFVKQRKAKKASITQTAIKGIDREARKAGISLNDALQEICARGWTGFKAEWMTKTVNQNLSYAERDELAKRKRWEEMTGRKWPEDDNQMLDVTPSFLELGQ
jgi:uncharacterized protein YdaU (DUF1376 family)